MSSSPTTPASPQPSPSAARGITVVLVHGAFADSSCWERVIALLQARGLTVVAVPNPLRGIRIDAAYVASALAQIDAPVLLVGHSYGGAVITNAATDAGNVLGLVYIAAFAPDEGELLGEVENGSRDSVLNAALVARRYPTGTVGQSALEFAIDPAKFRDAFAADLPPEQTALMAVTQRPIGEAAFSDPSGPPAWRRLPSWAVLPGGDKAVGADIVRSMAQRAGADIVELDGSHVIMMSRPEPVADLIDRAMTVVADAAAGLPAPRQAQQETTEPAAGPTA